MSNIAERIRNHRQKIKDLEIQIPEWGDESGPLKVWVGSPNLETRSEISKLAKDSDLKAFSFAVTKCCKDEDGKRIFDIQDRLAMEKEGDPSVVIRVGSEIVNHFFADIDAEAMGE